jgi:hypothetical protein
MVTEFAVQQLKPTASISDTRSRITKGGDHAADSFSLKAPEKAGNG